MGLSKPSRSHPGGLEARENLSMADWGAAYAFWSQVVWRDLEEGVSTGAGRGPGTLAPASGISGRPGLPTRLPRVTRPRIRASHTDPTIPQVQI